MTRILLFLAALAAVSPALAQRPHRPALIAEGDGKPEALGLERLEINASLSRSG
jgi:hypothetical protein